MLFKPSDSEQRSPPSYYRGCWHEVSRGFLWGRSAPRRIMTVCFRNPDSGLHPEGLHPTRGVAPSGLRPLRKIRYCSPPWGSGQCLSPNVPGQPLSPGTRRSLGRPLPYQLADGTWAAPRPIGPKVPTFDQQPRRAVGRIRYYQPFRTAIPVPGVRYPCITHPFATKLFSVTQKQFRATCMSQPRRQRSF